MPLTIPKPSPNAPENHRDILKINAVPNWFTKSGSPGAGAYNLETFVGAHGLAGIIQVDVRVVGGTLTYSSSGGGDPISAADSEWSYLPLHNGLDKIDVTIDGGQLEVICWGAKTGE